MMNLILAAMMALAAPPKGDPIGHFGYAPKRGDHAVIHLFIEKRDRPSPIVNIALHDFSYEDYWKANSIGDVAGTEELVEKGYYVYVSDMTRVLVLDVEEFPSEDPRPTCAVVRILEGRHRDKRAWVETFCVRDPVPNPDYDKPEAKAPPKAVDPDAAPKALPKPKPEPPVLTPDPEASEAADTLMTQADALGKSGKRFIAMAYYQRVVAGWPGTRQAKVAAARIKTMGK